MKSKKIKNLLWIACGIFLLSVVCLGIFSYLHTQKKEHIQKNIAQNILRFHVLANSNSKEDQELKLQVRDAVLDYLQKDLSACDDLETAKKIISEKENEILTIASSTIKKAGFTYSVTGEFTDCYFPEKSYGDATFPEGTYHAYQIQIGNSKGKNWWCVMYPPLCFIDATHGVLPDASKEQLHQSLEEDSYEAVLHDGAPVIRFKYLTFLNRFFD